MEVFGLQKFYITNSGGKAGEFNSESEYLPLQFCVQIMCEFTININLLTRILLYMVVVITELSW